LYWWCDKEALDDKVVSVEVCDKKVSGDDNGNNCLRDGCDKKRKVDVDSGLGIDGSNKEEVGDKITSINFDNDLCDNDEVVDGGNNANNFCCEGNKTIACDGSDYSCNEMHSFSSDDNVVVS